MTAEYLFDTLIERAQEDGRLADESALLSLRGKMEFLQKQNTQYFGQLMNLINESHEDNKH